MITDHLISDSWFSLAMGFLCLGDWKCRGVQLHQDLLKFYVDIWSENRWKQAPVLESVVVTCYCVSMIKYVIGSQAKSSVQ